MARLGDCFSIARWVRGACMALGVSEMSDVLLMFPLGVLIILWGLFLLWFIVGCGEIK